jgi:ubiquitin C-terminal hydrolase
MKYLKYSDKGLTGLSNLGNTCFINSTLQCISHTYELNEFFDNKKYKVNSENKLDCLLLNEWNNLREMMWSQNCIISPKGFIVNVHRIARAKNRDIFTGYSQNDLPEFLLFLFDSFHEALKRKVIIKITGNEKNTNDVIAKLCYNMIKELYEKEYSEIISLFYGTQVSEIKDLDGSIKSRKPEPFFMLDLPIPQDNKSPCIYDCLDLYTSVEKMDGDNKYYDEENDKKIVVNKKISFFNFPNILIIDFKRFNNSLRKNQILIDFPLDNLDLSKYIKGYNRDSYKYELYGVCNHMGSVMGGHYTSYVKNANGKWYLYNDTHITEISKLNEIVSPKAYCLFYRKVVS